MTAFTQMHAEERPQMHADGLEEILAQQSLLLLYCSFSASVRAPHPPVSALMMLVQDAA
jgi:hypothetical protein